MASTSKLVNSFYRLRLKRIKLLDSLKFLVSCKNKRLIPNFITLRCPIHPTPRIKKTLIRCKLQILRSVIFDLRGKIAFIERELYSLHLNLSKNLSPELWEKHDFISNKRAADASATHRTVLSKKFNSLLSSVITKKNKTRPNFNEINPNHLPSNPSNQNLKEKLLNNSNRNIINPQITTKQCNLNSLTQRKTKTVPLQMETQLDISLLPIHPSNHLPTELSSPQGINAPQDCVQIQPHTIQTNEPKNSIVINISGKPIDSLAISALSKGLNFAITPNSLEAEDILAPIERTFTYSKVNKDQLNFLRENLAKLLRENSLNATQNNMPKDEKTALKTLTKDKDLLISRSDKGGKIIIMHREQYLVGCQKIINEGPYRKIDKDNSLKLNLEVKKLVTNTKLIPTSKHELLINPHPIPGRFYALPKIHKIKDINNFNSVDLTFRPIIANTDMCTYPLAKYLVTILSPITKLNSFSIPNSKTFAAQLQSASPTKGFMASLDIISMYPSIPITGALTAVRSRLLNLNYDSNRIDEILTLIEICVRTTIFSFNENLYLQTDGLAMGNPLSPLLAEFYMLDIDNKIANNLHFPIELYFRYVDDSFAHCLFPVELLSEFLDFLNSLDPFLKFTIELERNQTLPFLDCFVTRHVNSYSTAVYRKPYSSVAPLHAQSNHLFSHKISAFYYLVKRAIDISSDEVSLGTEINFLKSIAIDRGFQPDIVDAALTKFKKPAPDSTLIPFLKDNTKELICVPFVSKSSFLIKKCLSKDFRVIFSPINKLQQTLSPLKDKIPMHKRWGIYKLSCQCHLSYIGQTKRRLELRIKEHAAWVRNVENKIKKKRPQREIDEIYKKSTISKHAIEQQHTFIFNESKIIKRMNYMADLDFHEAIQIIKHNKSNVNGPHTPYLNYVWKKFFSP